MNNQNYYAIQPIEAFINSKQIKHEFDDDLTHCHIIGITLYEGEALTFLVKLKGGECFRYIPITSLYWKQPKGVMYEMNDLIYHNNKSDKVKVNEIETLQDECMCYIKHRKQWIKGEYILSVDYYKNERMLNLIALENGQFALLPFHKIKFGKLGEVELKFDRFKKQTEKYIVDDDK